MIATNAKFAKPKKLPAYRLRRGYTQAIVTLTNTVTLKRRDYWLGEYGTSESREMYGRVIAAWEANGRRLPPPTEVPRPAIDQLTINELILAYHQQVSGQYKPPSWETIRMALRLLRQGFGTTAAADFGPKTLRMLRDQMIAGDLSAKPARKPWSRTTANKAVHQIAAVFKWATSNELLPVTVYQRLKTVGALRRGHTGARESEPVAPAPMDIVDAVRPHLNRQIRALVDLQLLTGARGGELFKLRPVDLLMDDRKGIWTITPADHKSAHHGHERIIYLGLKAQAVIRPFLIGRPVDSYLFSPAEAEAERRAEAAAKRKTALSCGNRAGTNRVEVPKRRPGDHYNASSYRRAIQRACDKVFGIPDHLRNPTTDVEKSEAKMWRQEHRWRPHQTRHAAATLIRREFGLETARIVMGHSSALVTDAVYAERDMARVVEVMKKIG